jgi:putative spermidine/putrescine transport system ATP-binding protein
VSTDAFVRVINISKKLGDRVVINDFSLGLNKGEFVGLLGRSGSGKTTILRLLAGLETPDSGEIWIAGSLVSKDGQIYVRPHLRGIGFVFQDLALWPHMTIRQSVDFVLAASGIPKLERRKRINDVLTTARIPDLGQRYPHQLSGGERQRAALARALAPAPQVLLLDEPMSSFDADLKSELISELKTLHRTLALTTIYVTHDVSEISRLADRTIQMSSGVLQLR